ncbi:hypothetical protein CTRI78_v000048 [Colletotrichum trifolii]|uniref:Uncharacterized protein n=1 Tax=Colletotrichum trifolii TaxID=5466 RepID=A0A4R8RSX4_COLTR|nr:hypothetical protein CTRI78_v000048 [Colletotrichum trifolii]
MSHRLDNDPKRSLTIQILIHYPYVFDYFPQSNLNLYQCLASMLARAEVDEPTVPEPTCYRTEEESVNFFTPYVADARYILDQPSPPLFVVRVREKAVNLAIAGISTLIFTNEVRRPMRKMTRNVRNWAQAVRKTMMLLQWTRVSDMIEDFLGGNSITDNRNKEPKTSKLSLAAVETWVIYVGEQHDAHDQLPMPGGMRRLWQHAWFTDPEQNAFAKVLNIDLGHVSRGLRRRLRRAPTHVYDTEAIWELVQSIDTNTTMSAPHRPNIRHRGKTKTPGLVSGAVDTLGR